MGRSRAQSSRWRVRVPVPNQNQDVVHSALESDRNAALTSSAIGAFGAAALGVVMMAPALGVYANLSLVFSSAGNAAPLVFLLALALTLPTALSYAMVSREVPSAGSSYTWISQSINRFAGSWAGLLLLVSYGAAVVLQPIVLSTSWLILAVNSGRYCRSALPATAVRLPRWLSSSHLDPSHARHCRGRWHRGRGSRGDRNRGRARSLLYLPRPWIAAGYVLVGCLRQSARPDEGPGIRTAEFRGI